MADTATYACGEKTPTGNKIHAKAGELIAMARGLKVRAAERAKIKGPDCPMAEAEADFAVAMAEHVFQLDGEWCKDHARVNGMANDISTIKRCAKWTLGLLASTVGVGGFWQVCQWAWAIIKHLAQ